MTTSDQYILAVFALIWCALGLRGWWRYVRKGLKGLRPVPYWTFLIISVLTALAVGPLIYIGADRTDLYL